MYPEGAVNAAERKYTMAYEDNYSIPEEVLEQICSEWVHVKFIGKTERNVNRNSTRITRMLRIETDFF